MSRSVPEVQESLQASIENVDPTIESRSGPVYNIMVGPVANEVSKIEAEQERIGALYSLSFQDVATEEETEALATNFGIQRATGAKARAVVYFFRRTRPVEPAVVKRGTVVGNLNGTLQYVVQQDAVIDPANADSFFNSTRGTYEVAVNVEAVSPGELYNIPSFRINSLIDFTTDFNGVENRAPASGGTEEETQASEVARIRQRFAGLNTGSIDGLRFVASNAFPEVTDDVAVVQPSSELFKRVILTPGVDVYIAGSNLESVNQTYVALGGETQIPLTSIPAVASSLVLSVNGVSDSDAAIIKDSGTLAGTTKASDYVLLDTPLNANDLVSFSYTYNRLVLDVQNIYEPTTIGDSLLFGTDILVFEAVQSPVTVNMSIRVSASSDVSRVTDQVQSTIRSIVAQNTFGITLFPETLRETILSTIQGVTSLDLREFRKTNSSLRDIEIIELEANEISIIDEATFELNVR